MTTNNVPRWRDIKKRQDADAVRNDQTWEPVKLSARDQARVLCDDQIAREREQEFIPHTHGTIVIPNSRDNIKRRRFRG